MEQTTFKNSYGNTYLTVMYDAENNWIYNNWSGLLSVDNVIKGASGVLEIIETTHCPNLLNDNTLVTGSWKEANTWIEKEWIPKAISLGLLKFAHIVPDSFFVKSSAEDLKTKVANSFEMKLFGNINDARNWLNPGE